MTTITTHSYFDQKMTITHNHDVILELHDPHDSKVKLETIECDLSQFLNGLAFMIQGEIDAQKFIGMFHKQRKRDY